MDNLGGWIFNMDFKDFLRTKQNIADKKIPYYLQLKKPGTSPVFYCFRGLPKGIGVKPGM